MKNNLASRPCHYDFGLRAIHQITKKAGQLLQKDPDAGEEVLTVIALREWMVQKLVFEDQGLFYSLLAATFPVCENAPR